MAARDRRRHRDPGGPGRGGNPLHHPRPPPGRAHAARWPAATGRRSARPSIPAAPTAGRAPPATRWPSSSTTRPSPGPSPSRTSSSPARPSPPASSAPSTTSATWPQLVHCATDGESYGHHSRFGEMALAAALEQHRGHGGRRSSRTTRPSWPLSPPDHEVEIRENTSWSCAHGVERWRSDCGCRMDPSTRQEWRGPAARRPRLARRRDRRLLRGARLRPPQGSVGGARRLHRRDRRRGEPAVLERFFAAQASAPLDAAARVEARRLLEMQRQRLLMFASCGWFFDDLAGLEPVQNLRYAAMALQYLRELGGPDLEPAFLDRLSAAAQQRSGGGHGRRRVPPARAAGGGRRAPAHRALRHQRPLRERRPARPASTPTRSRASTRPARPTATPPSGWAACASARS